MAKKRKVHSLTGRITFPVVHAAWKAVRRNRSAAGIDKVSVNMFEANLDENLQALMRDLKDGSQSWESGGSRACPHPMHGLDECLREWSHK